MNGSAHSSVSSIFTKWLQLWHLGPFDSNIVVGHEHLHSIRSRMSLLPSYLANRGGLQASQKFIHTPESEVADIINTA